VVFVLDTHREPLDPCHEARARKLLKAGRAADPLVYLDALRDYSLVGSAEQITCPTFVCNADADDISASAPQLAAALRCPHEFHTFTAAEGAGDHCEAGARTLFHARAFAWLDGILQPSR
jgi:hypothetical protein